MKQIILVIIFVPLLFGTSFAFDCPKCKIEMVEKDGTATCPKCSISVKISRTKIYNEPTVKEKIRMDENLKKDITEANKDEEYNSKIERIRELKGKIAGLEEELRVVEDEMKKIEWERRTGRPDLVYPHVRLIRRKEAIQESIRKHEFEIETIKRSL